MERKNKQKIPEDPQGRLKQQISAVLYLEQQKGRYDQALEDVNNHDDQPHGLKLRTLDIEGQALGLAEQRKDKLIQHDWTVSKRHLGERVMDIFRKDR